MTHIIAGIINIDDKDILPSDQFKLLGLEIYNNLGLEIDFRDL